MRGENRKETEEARIADRRRNSLAQDDLDEYLQHFLTSLSVEQYAGRDLVVSTLNIAKLSEQKLTLLIRYMELFHVDILCLQGVRLFTAEATRLKKRAAALMGPGSVVKVSILTPHADPEALRQSNRVGGH